MQKGLATENTSQPRNVMFYLKYWNALLLTSCGHIWIWMNWFRRSSRVFVGINPRRLSCFDCCQISIAQYVRGQVTLLALFDVSSAFDSVDHSILLQRLSTSFGLVDQPLDWLTSFLTDRSNCVVHGSSRSLWVPAPFGVPRFCPGPTAIPTLYCWCLPLAGVSEASAPTICRWCASLHPHPFGGCGGYCKPDVSDYGCPLFLDGLQLATLESH